MPQQASTPTTKQEQKEIQEKKADNNKDNNNNSNNNNKQEQERKSEEEETVLVNGISANVVLYFLICQFLISLIGSVDTRRPKQKTRNEGAEITDPPCQAVGLKSKKVWNSAYYEPLQSRTD